MRKLNKKLRNPPQNRRTHRRERRLPQGHFFAVLRAPTFRNREPGGIPFQPGDRKGRPYGVLIKPTASTVGADIIRPFCKNRLMERHLRRSALTEPTR